MAFSEFVNANGVYLCVRDLASDDGLRLHVSYADERFVAIDQCMILSAFGYR